LLPRLDGKRPPATGGELRQATGAVAPKGLTLPLPAGRWFVISKRGVGLTFWSSDRSVLFDPVFDNRPRCDPSGYCGYHTSDASNDRPSQNCIIPFALDGSGFSIFFK